MSHSDSKMITSILETHRDRVVEFYGGEIAREKINLQNLFFCHEFIPGDIIQIEDDEDDTIQIEIVKVNGFTLHAKFKMTCVNKYEILGEERTKISTYECEKKRWDAGDAIIVCGRERTRINGDEEKKQDFPVKYINKIDRDAYYKKIWDDEAAARVAKKIKKKREALRNKMAAMEAEINALEAEEQRILIKNE